MFDTLWQDIRYSIRRLLKNRGFTAAAVATLALGIGANTAIFGVINGVLLKPLPYPDPERLVAVWHDAPGLNVTNVAMAPSLYVTYRDQNRVFEDIGIWLATTQTITGIAEPEQVNAALVADGTLSVLAASPLLGRGFTPEDHTVGNPETVVLSYGYWQRRFGGQRSVVGQRLIVQGRPREVVGVLPATFQLLDHRPDVLLPLRFTPSQLILGLFNYQAVARLKPGVTLEQANADAARMLPIWARSFPMAPGFPTTLFENARITPRIRSLQDEVSGGIGSVLWIVMGTVGLVLLIACASVANLLLVRAEGRRQELAVRLALGARRASIAKELLVESLVLGAAGGILGLVLAAAALQLLRAIGPTQLPRLDEIGIDATVVLFAVGISLGSGVLFGLVPAFRYMSPELATTLHAGSHRQTYSRERHRTRSMLVVTQVALALVLLISAGLMIRTFQSLRQIDPGFRDPDAVQTFQILIPEAELRDPEQVVRAQHAILDRIATIPGVTAASFGQAAAMDDRSDHDPMVSEDAVDTDRQLANIRTYNFIAPGYFDAMGTSIIAGRDLTWTDVYSRRPVALISENLARELWEEPTAALGKRIRENLTGPWREVIGVVGNVHDEGVHQQAPAIVYWPTLLNDFLGQDIMVKRSVVFLVRSTRTGTPSFIAELHDAVWSVNRNLPLAAMGTVGDIYDRSMARTSFAMVMLAIAGCMALLLGLVGIYAVMATVVAQRTHEIGVRGALGARQTQIVRLILRHSLALSGVGVVIGITAATGLTRLLESVLFGVTPLDPVTFVIVSAALILMATLAAHGPARRAARIDPAIALRAE